MPILLTSLFVFTLAVAIIVLAVAITGLVWLSESDTLRHKTTSCNEGNHQIANWRADTYYESCLRENVRPGTEIPISAATCSF